MTVRTTMSNLITMIRDLIGDPAGTTAHFTDENIQDVFDQRCEIVRHEQIETIPTPTAAGLEYKDFRSRTFFENNAYLQDNAYGSLTPTTSSFINGYYTFATSQTAIPFYVTGKRYDVFGVAADLCHRWMASMSNLIDFTADGSSFKQSQQRDAMQKLYEVYALQAEGLGPPIAGMGMTNIYMERSDT